MRVAGIDVWSKGWIAITLRDGQFESASSSPRLAALIADLGDVATTGVDIPIGLPDAGRREADRLARAEIGPRRSSVFATPFRLAIEQASISEARSRSLALSGRSLTAQSFGLGKRILEADPVARDDPRVHEVHPEVSFAALAGSPLPFGKKTWAGAAQRRRLLRGAGIELPESLGAAGAAGMDDVLDAAVASWTAQRIAHGIARSLPPNPVPGLDGHRAAIWV